MGRAGVAVFKDFYGRNSNRNVHSMHSHGADRAEDALIKIVYVSLILNEFLIGRADNINTGYAIN